MEEIEKYKGIYSSTSPVFARYGHSNHGAKALPLILQWHPRRLVDVGCGYNEFAALVAKQLPTCRTLGIDFACPGADVLADAAHLPVVSKAYDVVTAFDMLEHVEPGKVMTVLHEFQRVARAFVFSISYVPSVNKWQGQTLHPTVQPESWWVERIKEAGAVRVEKFGHYIVGAWPSPDTSWTIPEKFGFIPHTPLVIEPGKRVILVGNGPSVLGDPSNGQKIDSFDEVIRFNAYATRGFAQFAGTKTTRWVTFGRGTRPDSTEKPPAAIFLHGDSGNPAIRVDVVHRIPATFFNDARARIMKRSKLEGDNLARILPSSGLVTTLWLLESVGVGQVTLIGFDHFKKDKSSQHHYWLPQAFGRPKEHDGDAEAEWMAELETAGKVVRLS